MKRPLIGRKYFHKLPLDKKNKLEGSWEVFLGRVLSWVFGKEEKDLGRGGELVCYV
jgi:hypothetical protein